MGCTSVAIRSVCDVEGLDLICRTCGQTSRVHPSEGFVEQVRLFLSQHRHGESGAGCRD